MANKNVKILHSFYIIIISFASISANFPTYQWIPGVFNQKLPDNALIGGHAEDHNLVFKLYVARARHEGEIIPGKLGNPKLVNYPPKVVIHIYNEHKFVDTTLIGGDFHCIYNNTEYWKPEFEILTGPEYLFEWVSMSPENEIPHNAIQGGNKKDGTIYYIGRAKHDGTNKEIGKVDGSDKRLYTSVNNSLKTWAYYEILTWNTSVKRKSNSLINTISVYYGNHNWIMVNEKQGILDNSTSSVKVGESSKTPTDPIIDKLLKAISQNSNTNVTIVDHLKIYQGNHNWIYVNEDGEEAKAGNKNEDRDTDPDKPSHPDYDPDHPPIDVRSTFPKAE